jgi:hypothetical protein
MANTSNLQYDEPFEFAPVTGKVHITYAKDELPQAGVDWRRITVPALIGASIFAATAGTSLVAHSYSSNYDLFDKSDLSRSGTQFISPYTAVISSSVYDDIPSPAFRYAGKIKGHFTKPRKLQFSPELFD